MAASAQISESARVSTRFNDVDEFLEELRAEPPAAKIVRVTMSFQQSQTLPVQNVSVWAGYMRQHGGILERVRLERYVGQRFIHHEDETSKKVMEKAEGLVKQISEAAKVLGLEVRAGVYE